MSEKQLHHTAMSILGGLKQGSGSVTHLEVHISTLVTHRGRLTVGIAQLNTVQNTHSRVTTKVTAVVLEALFSSRSLNSLVITEWWLT